MRVWLPTNCTFGNLVLTCSNRVTYVLNNVQFPHLDSSQSVETSERKLKPTGFTRPQSGAMAKEEREFSL